MIAIASNFNGFLVGMAIGGLGFGIYVAVDLALVVDVLPDKDNAAKDLGVFNMAGALPFSIAPESRRPSWRSAAAATACCTGWRSLRHRRSRRDPAREARPMRPLWAAREVEFPGPADRCPAVVHTELGVDVLGVRPHSVQRHYELASDLRTAQVGSEQPEHVQLAFAQWLGQALTGGGAVPGLVNGCQEPTHIARGCPPFCGRPEQGRHRRALIGEDPDVALRLSQRQGALQWYERSGDVALRLAGQRLQHEDLDNASRPLPLFGRSYQALQKSGRLLNGARSVLGRISGQERPGQGHVLELAQVAEVVVEG